MIGILLAAAVTAAAVPIAAAETPGDPQASLRELQALYQQSCGDRAYGSYNDLCNDMQRQIAAYRRELIREQRRRAKTAAARPDVGPGPRAAPPSASDPSLKVPGLAPSPPVVATPTALEARPR